MWPFPKKRDFFKMLSEQMSKIEEGIKTLQDFVYDPTPEKGRRVSDMEEEADEIRRVLVDELNQSFVTPIDREDIFALSRSVDDILDYAKSTVEEMTLFEVGTDEFLKKMVDALYDATRDISYALKEMKEHPKVCAEHIVRARKAENFIEHKYREGLAKLFKQSDVVKILKMREIYRHLSNAADRAAESADIIGDILVKTT
ncbi:MAG: DUF47 family protein [Elusimicrobia bacterium]|nr:DUF47 family protein [Elusimicrobiota bacterium]